MRAAFSKPAPRTRLARPRSIRTRSQHGLDEDGFQCRNCRAFVSMDVLLSGVENRNHCPYCLWSRHLDWQRPGDRLSACKGSMTPIGLTAKQVRKRYPASPGELMLVHRCQECGKISINRLAADDIPQVLLAVFEASFELDGDSRLHLAACGIDLLDLPERLLVDFRLFGAVRSGMAEFPLGPS